MTVLKTWTSSSEHSMIIHARVRFEFPEVSAARLALRSLNLTVLCLVVDYTLAFLLLREEGGLLAIPSTHWPRHDAIDPFFLPSANSVGRSALYLVCRPLMLVDYPYFLAEPCSSALCRYFIPAVIAGIHNSPPPYTCMEGFAPCLACLQSFRIEYL